jgi:hypothetical protein
LPEGNLARLARNMDAVIRGSMMVGIRPAVVSGIGLMA